MNKRAVISQCEQAIKSIEDVLTSTEFQECMAYVINHNEWLLGLEFAIDWLVEDDRKIEKILEKLI